VFPVRYEMGFYIPEDGVLHSHRRENLNLTMLHKFSDLLSTPKKHSGKDDSDSDTF
jgi:hypothetical protein